MLVARSSEPSDPLDTFCQVSEVKRVKKQAAMQAKAQDLRDVQDIRLALAADKVRPQSVSGYTPVCVSDFLCPLVEAFSNKGLELHVAASSQQDLRCSHLWRALVRKCA